MDEQRDVTRQKDRQTGRRDVKGELKTKVIEQTEREKEGKGFANRQKRNSVGMNGFQL